MSHVAFGRASLNVIKQCYKCVNGRRYKRLEQVGREQGPYEEIFVLTFKAYGSNAVSLERKNKYFTYGRSSHALYLMPLMRYIS